MPSAARRVTLGFQGGQVLALRVSEKQFEELNKALGGVGWHELDSEDGPVRVDLGHLVYVSADSSEPRVGFG
jgi:CRISPR/Cas system-associated protein endoribonuclease Cas2